LESVDGLSLAFPLRGEGIAHLYTEGRLQLSGSLSTQWLMIRRISGSKRSGDPDLRGKVRIGEPGAGEAFVLM
jgi:hypothetical protein